VISPLLIIGDNLSGATAINFRGESTGITYPLLDSTQNQVTAEVTIGANVPAGLRNVSVTTANGTTTTSLDFTVNNHAPSLSSIAPNEVVQGSTGVTLTVRGSGFFTGSVVKLDGSNLATTFLSTTEMSAQLPGGLIAGVKKITVFNPLPGGGESDYRNLTVTGGTSNPIPHIGGVPPSIGISPPSVVVGSGAFTLTVTSDNSSFRTGAVVRVNGVNRSTTFVSQSQLTASMMSGDAAIAGPKDITVFNPIPGGGTSNTVTLNVVNASFPPPGTGLSAEYFNNMSLTGPPALTRVDPKVDFNWGTEKPAYEINKNQFSVRWTGQVQANITGNYTFYTRTDDGVRLWVNNQYLIDLWRVQEITEWSNTIKLYAGQKYNIRMEYFDNSGVAEAHLLWSMGSSIPKQVIPTSQLYPPGAPLPPKLYEGLHEATNCTSVSGWAADRNQPSSSTTVDIYVDNGVSPYATVTANQPHSGVPISGDHGFSYTVPAALKDGQSRSIKVKIGGTTTLLSGSPQTLVCAVGSPVPAAPSSLTAIAVSATQINLLWIDNSNNEDGFKIERQDPGQPYVQIGNAPASATTYSDPGRATGVLYNYRVSAYNGAGSSGTIQTSITIPGGPPAPPAPPAAPSNVVATAVSSSQINLAWTDLSNNETGFRVLLKKVGGTTYTTVAIVGANVTSYSHKNLVPLTLYCYRIESYNDSGAARNTVDVCATTTNGLKAALSVALLSGNGAAGSYGYTEGPGTTAKWRSPGTGVVGIDPVSGVNALFVADTQNHRIRMVYLDGPAQGHSILIAGSGIAGYWEGDGDPYSARYNNPRGIAAIKNEQGAVDALLIADTDNHTIRLLLPPLGGTRWRPETFSGKQKAAYADGTATQSEYNSPYGITIGTDDFIYVADSSNGAIRKLDWAGNSSTYFKVATWKGSTFRPIGIASSGASNWIYISSHNSNSINRVTGGVIEILSSAVAGYADGAGGVSKFNTPYHLVWSDTGGVGSLSIVDLANNRIRLFDLQANLVSTLAGSGAAGYVNGSSTTAKFDSSTGIAIGPSNELYIVESGNSGVRKLGEQ
jgi:hypothetical protein